MKTAAIIAAGGSATRMGVDKLLLSLCGKSVLRRATEKFHGICDEIVVACPPDKIALYSAELEGLSCRFCPGGSTRTQSVRNAIALLHSPDYVLIHDGARPLVTTALINACIDQAVRLGSAVAGVKAKDTVKICEGASVKATPDRNGLWMVHTPQCFDFHKLTAAYSSVNGDYTDDASVYENAGNAVYMLEGSYSNIKLTTPEDVLLAEALLRRETEIRVGTGYDVHAFAVGRQLVLCGVHVPCSVGLDGHSDADVAVHAIMDALLGAAGLRDIGTYFPDNNPAYKGADSMQLLLKVLTMVSQKNYEIQNIDCTIIAQTPKLSPYIEQMKQNLADTLLLDADKISVKATTTEGLGFCGRKEGIAAQASVLIRR